MYEKYFAEKNMNILDHIGHLTIVDCYHGKKVKPKG